MKSPAKILRNHANMLCSLGKGSAFRIPKFSGKTMLSRGDFYANLFATHAIYCIFGRRYHLQAGLILFPCTQISFSYPSYTSEVLKSLFESILTSDF